MKQIKKNMILIKLSVKNIALLNKLMRLTVRQLRYKNKVILYFIETRKNLIKLRININDLIKDFIK